MKLSPDRKVWKHWRRAVRQRVKASPDLRREQRRTRPRAARNYSWSNLRVLVSFAIAGTVLGDGPIIVLSDTLLLWTTLLTFVRAQQIATHAHDPNLLWLWYGWPVTNECVFRHHRGFVLRSAVWLVVDWLVFGLAVAWKNDALRLAVAAPIIGLAQGATALAVALWLARWRPKLPFIWVTTPLTLLVFLSVQFSAGHNVITTYLDKAKSIIHSVTPAGWLMSGWINIANGDTTGWWVVVGIGGISCAAVVAGTRAMRKAFDPDALFGYANTSGQTDRDAVLDAPTPLPAPKPIDVDMGLLRARAEGVLTASSGQALSRRGVIEQAATWFLTKRQCLLIDFMLPVGMSWNRRWLIALALFILVIITGQTSSPELRMLPSIAALACALPVLGGRWLGFEAMRSFQTQIGLTSYVPIGFWEVCRLLLTINAVYCLIAFPFVVAVTWLGLAPSDASPGWAIDYSLRGIGLVLALQPIWLVSKFSTNTNDSSTGRLWFAGLVVLIITGLIIGVSLCVVAVMIDSTMVSLSCIGTLALFTHIILALYGQAWGRGWFDLIAKIK